MGVTKRKPGPPSGCTPAHVARAEKMARTGMTDVQLAAAFEISKKTLNVWKKNNPAFAKALAAGKGDADDVVERSLFERATGYSHEAVKIFCDKGHVTRAKYTEHYPPDVTACIFWLKNRRPEEWRDRQEITGKNGEALGFVGFQIVPPAGAKA